MMRLLTLQGDSYQIGFQHGSLLKPSIVQVIELLHQIIRHFNPLIEEKLPEFIQKYLTFAENYAPELVSEMRGIADATGISFEEIFAFNSIDEVINPVTAGCTAFAIPPTCVERGSVLIGQNTDWLGHFSRHFVTLSIRRNSGLRILMTTPAGFIGYVGQNSKGIGVNANALLSPDSKPGVPVPIVTRKILEQETIGDAIDCLVSAQRSCSENYIIADANGEIYDIETTATDYEVIYIEDRAYAHANHYTSQRLRNKTLEGIGRDGSAMLASSSIFNADSFVRANRLSRLLASSGEKIDIEHVQKALADHCNYPRSICRHTGPGTPENKWEDSWQTNTSIVSDLSNAKSWVAYGNPCISQYQELHV